MSNNKQDKAKHNLLRQIWQLSKTNPRQQIDWLLRSVLVAGRQANNETGFVLPTVAMVSLVVVLLSVSLVVRSFDRSRNASNVRVNQVVLNAATPALDRARAKIDALLSDPTLPRSTPSDIALDKAFDSSKYNFGDETRLKLINNFGNGAGGSPNTTIESRKSDPPTSLENDETITTAWKYPVDTDNNGKFDSYTLYGVYFRSPSRDANGKFNRQRNTLEARTPPMSGGTIGNQCANANGTTANLVGDSTWYKSGNKLAKSFYVYTATVPITQPPSGDTTYEAYTGNRGFIALEYQQDRSRIPLNNNAVVFQDDIEISPGTTFRLNGRVFTNANLLIGSSNTIRLYQVSSKYSCFYNEENSKITVGGNVSFGGFGSTASSAVTIDLFKGFGIEPGSATINSDNKSTTNSGSEIAYNDAAYNRRISLMKATALSYIDTTPTVDEVLDRDEYPQEVKDRFQKRMEEPESASLNIRDVLGEEIEIYLRDRTRRVPFKEIGAADGTGAIAGYTPNSDGVDTSVFSSTPIEPPAIWREPTDTNTKITLTLTKLDQTQPEKQRKDGIETYVGDRVNVGNNLPGFWKKDDKYVTGPNEPQLLGNNIFWNNPSDKPRYRTTQVVPLPDLGATERNGLWEDAAAQSASNESPNVGGLRVITGAGIYRNQSSSYSALSTSSLMPAPVALDSGGTIPNAPLLAGESTASPYNLVWYDTTPMKGGSNSGVDVTAPPDLRMRATAVYHYKSSSGINQLPIACVSSYYDPTDSVLAQNGKYGTTDGFPWGSSGTNLPINPNTKSLTNPNGEITGAAGSGRSNNGVVYPSLTALDRTAYMAELKAQAKLMFPNGRIVNEPLQKALQKLNASGGLIDSTKPLSLAENSAIDSTVCAIKILTGGSSFTPSSTVIPHGAIKETAFLNAREVKAIEGTDSNPINYDLALEQRQPLEIRVTEIDLRQLASTTIGGSTKQEYLLPNSGIIYASRDDALLDLSDPSSSEVQKKLLSPTDFRLDPTRRPNGIRLINGSNLTRVATYREEEKGLILASNLPVYVKADANNGFNLHQKPGTTTAVEEFLTFLTSTWGNFYDRNNPDNNFACRSGQTGCATGTGAGDQWRPATIIADTMTLLSNSFRDGFRNEGDFDLNNNAGTTVTAARRNNGFWNNSFVTSAFWWLSSNTDNAYPYQKTSNSYVGSYLINGVTPIQRRVADFSEYLMEYCPKIPVSLCTPSDWVINTSNAKATGAINQTFNIATHQAGTTAIAANSDTQQRYARRIAFKRKSNNTLELTSFATGEATPIPLGIDSSGVIKEFPYSTDASATLPRRINVNNALWFQTSNNRTGQPNLNTTFKPDQPLSYTGQTKLISPPTPEIPGVRSLNLPADKPASSYTICTDNQGSTTKASISVSTPLEKADCDSTALNNPLAAIENTLTDLLALNPNASLVDEVSRPIQVGIFAAGTPTVLTQTNRTNVVDIPDLPTSSLGYTTIKLVRNPLLPNPIFVLRKTSSNLGFGGGSGHYGVKVELDGVDPNNVFWAVNGNMMWNAVSSSTPHRMSGTFINKGTGSPKWENLILEGGRILGVNVIPSPSNFTSDTRIEAIASSGQPELVPVLQVHTPAGTPTADSDTLPVSGKIELEWLQNVTAAETKINATFVAGNSPSRPTEGADDLENFVRFLERWSSYTNIDAKRTLNIRGSFIQPKRSTYATGPKNAGLNSVTSLFPGFTAALYPDTSDTGNKTPYAEAPDRQWGFDVGILAQSLDLFAQRFTTPTKTPPNEFFRQVGQDDPWVKNLLCAAQGSGSTYTAAIGEQRPTSCPVLSLYND